jgi:hypothetical protein
MKLSACAYLFFAVASSIDPNEITPGSEYDGLDTMERKLQGKKGGMNGGKKGD